MTTLDVICFELRARPMAAAGAELSPIARMPDEGFPASS